MGRSQTTLKKPHLMFQPSWDVHVVPATGSWPPPQLEEDLALKGSGKIASGSKRQWTDEVKTAFVIIRLVALACSCFLDLSVCFHPSISSRTRSARALLLVWCTTLVGSDEFWRSATALASGGSNCARPCPRVWTSQVVEGTDSVEQRQTNACLLRLLSSGGTRPPG